MQRSAREAQSGHCRSFHCYMLCIALSWQDFSGSITPIPRYTMIYLAPSSYNMLQYYCSEKKYLPCAPSAGHWQGQCCPSRFKRQVIALAAAKDRKHEPAYAQQNMIAMHSWYAS